MVNDFPYFLAQVFTLDLIVLPSNDKDEDLAREEEHDNCVVDNENEYDEDEYESQNVAHFCIQEVAKQEH